MESRRVVVSGLPDGTTETQLVIHFQSEKVSGGGDIETINLIERGKAIITFEEQEAVKRVLQRGSHRFQESLLQVEPVSTTGLSSSHGLQMDNNSKQRAGNSAKLGERERCVRREDQNSIRHQRDRGRYDSEIPVPVERGYGEERNDPGVGFSTEQCTIKVTRLPENVSEDAILNYFENARRSKGGPVVKVAMKPELEMCLVTFECSGDAQRTVEHSPHCLESSTLEVSLLDQAEKEETIGEEEEEFNDETNLVIIVNELLPRTTKDAVWNYFENSRRSGGGEISSIDYCKGSTVATIMFTEVKDRQRLLEGSHKIDGKDLTVVKQPPKKKVPLDPCKVFVQGLNERTSEDCLRFYLEKFSGVEVIDVRLGCDGKALVYFDAEVDFSHLFDRVSKDTKGLEGAKPHLERVPVCSSILVTGLDKGTSDETVELYFENSKKSGGGDVNGLERKAEDQAIVHFKDPSSVWEVMRKDHTLERKKLSVKPYYAFLGENASDKPRNSAAKDEVPKFIFHAVPLQSGDIKETILKCLQEAEKQGISSISFPAIGTGNLGMSAKSSAGAMMNAVYKFSLQNPGSVALVRVVVFAQDLLPDFRSAMAEASGEKPAGQPTMWSRFKNFIGFGDDQDSTEPSPTIGDSYEKELNLFIYAGRRQDLQNAAEAVKEVMTENSSTKLIENKAISDLTERHRRQIRTLELKYDVEISVEVVVARIVVRGHSYDVLNAVGDIHEILHKLKDEEHDRHQAEILAKSVQWSFKENEVYEEFEPLLNAQIESAYDQKKYKTIITLDEERVELNFQAMTLTDLTTRDTTELRRVDHREGVNAPDYWVPQPKNLAGKEVPVHVLELTAVYNPKEFKDVSDKFCQTCPNNPIQKIERVQNLALYGTYAIRRKGMDERNGSNEMQLFHGTAGDSCDKINHAGFNRGFCGKNATMFGNGVYFAKDASYSARPQYSPPDANWLRYMYLARVLVGEYAVGHPGLILPPQRNQHDETDRYDSAVDQLGNPGIFVAFYDWQCYPEYLITFK